MKKLADLYKFFGKTPENEDVSVELNNLEMDSRQIKKNDVFVAVKGTKVNALSFAKKAQDLGAAAIVIEYTTRIPTSYLKDVTIPLFIIPKKSSLGDFASWFYDDPSDKLGLIGITGTNGKSTITTLISQWIELANYGKCAVFGTLGYGFLPNLKKSANTTIDSVRLQRALRDVVNEHARFAALEVSSIGVCEGRVDSVHFVAGAFTNLTRDHLDYHKTMENYAKAKEDFLKMVPKQNVIINIDNEQGRAYSQNFPGFIAYSCSSDFNTYSELLECSRYVWIRNISYKPHSIHLEIESSFGTGECEIGLLGHFNVENFACALATLLSLGFDFDRLLQSASELKPIKGRMECFSAPGKPHVIVDYAHTPDGVEQVLRGVRQHFSNGLVYVVLGCGGDRDKGKRPIMAIKASIYADRAVFTSDNPRTEDPKAILDDMALGVAQADNVVMIEDREKAIEYAFSKATENDCIVIGGKGHEDYQIFKDKTIHFSDREIACRLLGVKCD